MTRNLVCSLVGALVLAGCTGGGNGGGEQPPDGVVAVGAREYAYDVPSEVPSGPVMFEFTNEGRFPHEFGLVRLEEEATVEDLEALFASGESFGEEIVMLPGGSILSGGLSATMSADLEAGSYAFYCLLPTPSGAKHFEQGMIAGFEAGPEESNAPTPEPDVVVAVDDDGYEVPAIAAGRRVVEFRNEKEDFPHGFHLVSYEPGRHKAYLDAWLQGRLDGGPPAIFPGGPRDVPPGESVVMEIEFKSGRTYTFNDPVAAEGAEIVVE